jgi:RND family efflux transporter MFP subunit
MTAVLDFNALEPAAPVDRARLLEQLRIARTQAAAPAPARRAPGRLGIAAIAAVALAALVAAGAAGLQAWHDAVPRVQVATVVRAPGAAPAAASVLDASGYIIARRAATISAKIAGRLDRLMITEGQHVDAGQVIAGLDDSNARATLAAAQAQLESSQALARQGALALEHAQREAARTESLAADRFVSQAQVDKARDAVAVAAAELETARRNVEVARRTADEARLGVDDTVVRAPFAGMVTARAAQPGEIVSPLMGGGLTRTGIATLVDMASLEADVDVSESFIGRLQVGQAATLTLVSYPDRRIAGHVSAIVPTVDRAKGTVEVHVAIDEADARLLPNMGVRVSLGAGARGAAPHAAAPPSWQLPADAVRAAGLDGTVLVVHDGTVSRRPVRLAAAPAQGVAIVTQGLADGDRVVTGAAAGLADGTKVDIQQ